MVFPELSCDSFVMVNGTDIRTARERAGLSQRELADRVGVSERTVGNWERGATVPRNRMGLVEEVLGNYLWPASGSGEVESLHTVSDAALLGEVARRLGRAVLADQYETRIKIGRNDPTDPLGLVEPTRQEEGGVEDGDSAPTKSGGAPVTRIDPERRRRLLEQATEEVPAARGEDEPPKPDEDWTGA